MRRDLPDAVLRILPRGRRLHSVGQGSRHYGGAGPWFGAGAMVAYSMGITELDPLKHGLIFERFLNLSE